MFPRSRKSSWINFLRTSILCVFVFCVMFALSMFLPRMTEAAKTDGGSNSQQDQAAKLRDGKYEGRTDVNYRGTVVVTVEEGKIKEIQAKPIGKDARYKKEIDVILTKVVESQEYHVDAYSGATRYTVAVVKAVENALRDAEVKETPSE